VKVKGLAAALALLTAATVFADSKQYTVTDDGKNYVSFESQATLETIKGVTMKVSGTVTADPAHPENATTEVTIDLNSLDTGIEMRNGDLRSPKFVDTAKYPTATFKSVSVTSPVKSIDTNKPVELKVTGDFTVHGVTKRMTLPVRVVLIPESEVTKASRGAGDWIHASSKFPINLQDFNLPVPQKLMMKLADTIDITLDVFAVARPATPSATK
jgi:polyisoprenoid-binding protein YceI